MDDAAKNIYKANVGIGWEFNTLYENGGRAVKARYPNTGYLHTVDGSDGFTNHTIGPPEAQGTYLEAWLKFGSGNVPNWSDMVGGEVYIWGYWDWFSSTLLVAPTVNDGSQTKTFTLPMLSTTAIRVRFDIGNSDGWSFMNEIQVYGPSNNLALRGNGGNAAASSYLTLYGGSPPSKLNDNTTGGYWNDNTQYNYPDWCEINWATQKTVNQVILRVPVMPTNTQGQ